MSFRENKIVRALTVSLALILAFAAILNINAQNKDEKDGDYIEVIGKVLSIDPIKGDVTTRLEFEPHGSFAKEDLSLAKNIKFDTVSANGKQEITFEKGKRISPSEVVLNMYDGQVSDYPFDSYKANLSFFFTIKPDKEKPADKPKPAGETGEGEPKPTATPAEAEDEDDVEVPFTLDFAPAAPGYTITTAKSKDSDESYIDLELTIVRGSVVKFFSVFVMALMIGLSLAVLMLTFTVVIKGRKIELAMFSFIATLLFAFVAVRNSQPGVPPIGITVDFVSFFLAEVVLALCLLTIVLTWVFRKPA